MSIKNLDHTKLKKGFLYDKALLNLKITMDAVWKQFCDTGRIDAFKCDWKEGMDKKPHYYWDSDVAKWMEAAAYLLGKEDIPELKEKVEWLIDRIEENQGEDGYFNIYFTVCDPENRFKFRSHHELYCAGHLMEAATAYYENTGDERFLNLMEKYADYIYKVFAEEKSAEFATPGHEEIELALIRMYQATGKKKLLDLAMYFINTRGEEKEKDEEQICDDFYTQSHLPVREQKEAVGHSVRALYLYSAMASAAKETGDKELLRACETLFSDMVDKKMHITGGLGQNHFGEAFTLGYDLKNEEAYAETCASIAMILFCERMFDINHSSVYTDIIEKELYNGMMSGLSLSGDKFFYTNPSEINLKNHERKKTGWRGREDWLPITQRPEIFECSCCPPNLNRTLASIERLVYYRDGKDIYINQFAESEYNDGEIFVSVKTDYPNNGEIKVSVEGAENVYIRIPAFSGKFTLSAKYKMVKGYAKTTDKNFTLKLDMTPKFMTANENVADDMNKIAVTMGPVVYCAEGVDNKESLQKIYLNVKGKITTKKNNEFLLPTIKADAFLRKTDNALYSEFSEKFKKTTLNMIPYYAFANRGETDMKIWFYYK